MLSRVFVYGSLKRGFRHHEELSGGQFVGSARTAPGYALFVYDGYPVLVEELVGGCVEGELYDVEAALLARLDLFEDCPTLYQRRQVPLSDGQRVWAYCMTRAAVLGCARVPGDQWREGV